MRVLVLILLLLFGGLYISSAQGQYYCNYTCQQINTLQYQLQQIDIELAYWGQIAMFRALYPTEIQRVEFLMQARLVVLNRMCLLTGCK